ncbi:hypothetical protein P22_0992 [Propionispora sp. 2/2-37]|uniref:6-phospho-3-hexuloisomerase n=1 Tax=Propionispora sp. 2/2-37 TaxID=1677858 RepID=UPI0006BB9866|nr:6-phospho-3-hexuloisomerase [Propionispora sp. 2/2-37]CUH94923.1 hypothetical protein P22_0992 [Propionispora sp. 2/2-37]
MSVEYFREILRELEQTLERVAQKPTEVLTEAILQANRIFLAGAGRSGLMARAFAMRLMHMGFTVSVVGETVTPALGRQDLLLLASGSGETGSLVSMANKCKAIQAKLAVITIVPQSTIGRMADVVIEIPASIKENNGGNRTSLQPMGSLFEQTLLLLTDTVILKLMELRKIQADAMFGRHANLE